MTESEKTFKNYHCKPIASMRIFCVQCMGFNVQEPAKCEVTKCPLFPYRTGKRPEQGSKPLGKAEGLEICKRTHT